MDYHEIDLQITVPDGTSRMDALRLLKTSVMEEKDLPENCSVRVIRKPSEYKSINSFVDVVTNAVMMEREYYHRLNPEEFYPKPTPDYMLRSYVAALGLFDGTNYIVSNVTSRYAKDGVNANHTLMFIEVCTPFGCSVIVTATPDKDGDIPFKRYFDDYFRDHGRIASSAKYRYCEYFPSFKGSHDNSVFLYDLSNNVLNINCSMVPKGTMIVLIVFDHTDEQLDVPDPEARISRIQEHILFPIKDLSINNVSYDDSERAIKKFFQRRDS